MPDSENKDLDNNPGSLNVSVVNLLQNHSFSGAIGSPDKLQNEKQPDLLDGS